jgi:hypothetical protein
MNLGLNLPGAAALAATEMYGDWYRDPWGWPELAAPFVAGLDAEADLGLRKRADEYHLSLTPYFHLMEVPKALLGVRPAVVQDPLSRLAYLAAVAGNLAALHEGVPEWVYGWRVRDGGSLAPNKAEWASYTQTLPTADDEGFGLITDITSFFASVDPEKLRPILRDRLGNVASLHVLMDVIESHNSLSSRSGLPQRSFASAVLAHVFLRPIDDVLETALSRAGVAKVRRWMDDISAEGDEESLFGLYTSLQSAGRQLGLELNASKTRLASASEASGDLRLEDLREIEVPMNLLLGGEYDDLVVEPDLEVLLRLEDDILREPHNVKRPLARAVLKTLRDQALFDRWPEWLSVARYVPHAADTLSRYLRSAGDADAVDWEVLASWFDRYRSSAWGGWDWVSSQYALIFPAKGLPGSVESLLRTWLATSVNLQQVSIAVQRLSVSAPALVRTEVRSRVDRTADPLLLRVFGLGLLAAGEARPLVASTLTRDPRNGLLVSLLDNSRWQVPDVVKDFDSAPESDV